eukprot:CAMPEP_0194034994 /NCGR_PEP_ID=MMETSP0009_2-20130614/7455_1 /TAXON_ID=210454 /ORGANISM="Grammatophora oceanica, Strain CCMP 410" /LENGTH=223 /DNA_ID=CAMNT_0038676175 /DNA_START=35 /DNA_END=706 /DNA_ORIENTATION=-
MSNTDGEEDRLLPIRLPDEPRTDIPEGLVYPPEYEGHFEHLLLTKDEIIERTRVMAMSIHNDYRGKRPVLVCVLKGANTFYQHLLEALQDLKQGYTTEFLRASSYSGVSSTGTVKVGGGIKYEHLKSKHVLLVEDIVDTGTTLLHLIPILQKDVEPMSLEVCTLLEKRLDEPPKVDAKYKGFSIPNFFIVGYGLDYNELYRDVSDIWTISQKGIDFDPSSLPN